MVNVLDCDMIVSEYELQSHYYGLVSLLLFYKDIFGIK